MFSKFVATVVVIFMLAGSLLLATEDKNLTNPRFLDAVYAQLVERAQADPSGNEKLVTVLTKLMKVVPEEEAFAEYRSIRYMMKKFSPESDQMTFVVLADYEGFSGARLGDVVFLKRRVVQMFVDREMPEIEFAGVVAHEMGHGHSDALLKQHIFNAKLPQAYKDAMLCRVEAEADARSLALLKSAGYNLKQAMLRQKNSRHWRRSTSSWAFR